MTNQPPPQTLLLSWDVSPLLFLLHQWVRNITKDKTRGGVNLLGDMEKSVNVFLLEEGVVSKNENFR